MKHLKENGVLKRSVAFYRMLASYLLVLLAPLIFISVIIQLVVIPDIKREQVKKNEDYLISCMQKLDNELEAFSNIAYSISRDYNLSPYLARKNQWSTMNILRTYQLSNAFADGMLYYVKDSNRIYSSEFVCDLDMLSTAYYPFIESGEFKDLLNNLVTRNVKRFTDEAGMNYIFFFYPINYSTHPYGVIVFILKEESLRNTMIYEGNTFNNIFLYDALDNPILPLAYSGFTLENAQLNELLSSAGYTYKTDNTVQKGRYVISSLQSVSSGVKILSVVDNMEFYKMANNIQAIILIAMVSIVLIGMVLILVLSRFNYRPVVRIMELLVKNRLLDGFGGQDEYSIIETAISSAAEEKRALAIELEQNRQLLRNHILKEFMRLKGCEQAELEKVLDAGSKGCQYTCLLLNFSKQLPIQEQQTLQQIEHRVQTSWPDVHFCCCFPDNEANRLILLIAAPRITERLQKEIGEGIIDLWPDNLRPGILTGNICKDLLDTAKSYMDAIYTDVKTFERSAQEGLINTKLFKKKTDALIKSLEDCRIDDAKQILAEFYTSISNQHMPYPFVRCLIYDLFNTVLGLFQSYGLKNAGFTRLVLNGSCYGNDGDSHFDIDNNIISMTQALCEDICARKGKHAGIIDNVLKYVEANYCDHSISLEKLSDLFGFMPSQLSVLFKEHTGMTFSNKLWLLRLKRAKELLCNTDMSITEIVDAVGYYDVSSFARKFKETEGEPPGAYRQRNKLDDAAAGQATGSNRNPTQKENSFYLTSSQPERTILY